MIQTDQSGMFFRQMINDAINFGEACKILKIEKYQERIFKCHPSGELYFLQNYIQLAKLFKDTPEAGDLFVKALDKVIESSDDKDVDLVFINAPIEFYNVLKEMYKK